MTLRRLETLLEIKEAKADSGEIVGYGSVFDVVDDGMDRMAPGAFAKSISSYGPDRPLPMLWQHDPSDPIGGWTELAEDERGLRLKGRIVTESSRGRDAVAFLRAGVISGLSIGFRTQKADVDRASGVRTLTEVELWETSLVTFPMNRQAQVESVKLADAAAGMTERDIERALRDAGLSRGDAKAAVSRLMDLGAARDAPRIREAVSTELRLARLASILNT